MVNVVLSSVFIQVFDQFELSKRRQKILVLKYTVIHETGWNMLTPTTAKTKWVIKTADNFIVYTLECTTHNYLQFK